MEVYLMKKISLIIVALAMAGTLLAGCKKTGVNKVENTDIAVSTDGYNPDNRSYQSALLDKDKLKSVKDWTLDGKLTYPKAIDPDIAKPNIDNILSYYVPMELLEKSSTLDILRLVEKYPFFYAQAYNEPVGAYNYIREEFNAADYLSYRSDLGITLYEEYLRSDITDLEAELCEAYLSQDYVLDMLSDRQRADIVNRAKKLVKGYFYNKEEKSLFLSSICFNKENWNKSEMSYCFINPQKSKDGWYKYIIENFKGDSVIMDMMNDIMNNSNFIFPDF